jgi:hypothetical protein
LLIAHETGARLNFMASTGFTREPAEKPVANIQVLIDPARAPLSTNSTGQNHYVAVL